MKAVYLACNPRLILLILFALTALLTNLPLGAEQHFGDAVDDEDAEEIALLLKIAYIDLRQRERKLVEIPLEAGDFESPEKGTITDRIAIYPGNPILHGRRPKDRRVQFYRGTDKDRILLGTLYIRYYAKKKYIWLPRFKIHQETVLVPVGKEWRPVSTVPGATEPLVLTGSSVPNAEGYYPRLKIGFGSERFFLDSWVID